MIVHYGSTLKRMEMLAVSVRKMKALTVKMDSGQTMKMGKVTVIGKDGISHVFCVKCMKLTVKHFYIGRHFIRGFVFDLDKCIFPWQTRFIRGHVGFG